MIGSWVKTSFYFFIPTLLVVASSWLVYQIIFQPIPKPSLSHRPDVIAHQLTVIRYNREGNIKTTLTAPTMIHFSRTKQAWLQQPQIILYGKHRASPWFIRGDRGVILQKQNKYKLIGNVYLHQPAGINQPETTITTSVLNFYPKQHLATTNKRVHFTQKTKHKRAITMEAIGAKIYQQTGQVKLLSHIRGTYVLLAK